MVSVLIFLMVGTNISAGYVLSAHPSYSRRTGVVSGPILLMVGTNISAGKVLILLMAGELAQLPGSSF